MPKNVIVGEVSSDFISENLPNLPKSMLSIPVYYTDTGYSGYRFRGDDHEEEEIYISPYHKFPKSNLVSTLAHEFSHKICGELYGNYTKHTKNFYVVFITLCPKRYWKYEWHTVDVKKRGKVFFAVEQIKKINSKKLLKKIKSI